MNPPSLFNSSSFTTSSLTVHHPPKTDQSLQHWFPHGTRHTPHRQRTSSCSPILARPPPNDPRRKNRSLGHDFPSRHARRYGRSLPHLQQARGQHAKDFRANQVVQSSRGEDARVESFKRVKGYGRMGKRNFGLGKYTWQRATSMGLTQGKDKDIKARLAPVWKGTFSFRAFLLRLDWFLPLAWACDDINRFEGKGNLNVLAKMYK